MRLRVAFHEHVADRAAMLDAAFIDPREQLGHLWQLFADPLDIGEPLGGAALLFV
jgi:hypothetical protein